MVRAFVAFELCPEMRQQMAAAQELLKKSTARLTFVDPAIIHITIKFLGEVDEKKIPQVIAALSPLKSEAIPIRNGRITADNPVRPRTIWCTIEDAGKCGDVFAAVETALAPLGFPRETRKFNPHATLARVREADPSLFRVLDSLKGVPCGSCIIAGIKLKKSTLTPRGPVYEDLCEVKW